MTSSWLHLLKGWSLHQSRGGSNPQKCGHGAEAEKRAGELTVELPGFKTLAPGKGLCQKIEETIRAYEKSIDGLLNNSHEFTQSGYKDKQNLKNEIIRAEYTAQGRLSDLKAAVNNGENLLINIRGELETLATQYQHFAQELSKYSKKIELKKSLEMASVRNLGEWSQLPSLIFLRLDRPSTYVYLSLAFFVDWILVYLFSRRADLRKLLPSKRNEGALSGIRTPWQQ